MENKKITKFLRECYGDGYGDGSGYGDGYGSGSGDGYGDGSGDGSGYGSGAGDGIKSINGAQIYYIDGIATMLYHIFGNTAKGAIVRDDMSIAPCYVVSVNGICAHGETLRAAADALRDKQFMQMPPQQRADAFRAEFKPGCKYPAMLYFDWHHKLTGSCEFGRMSFVCGHEINLDCDEFTPEQFISLVLHAYGSEVIALLAKLYGVNV